MGLPSRCFTSKLHADGQPPHVVAYQLGTPGTISSDAAVSGSARCTGERHPAMPAAPMLNPISERKSRREGSATGIGTSRPSRSATSRSDRVEQPPRVSSASPFMAPPSGSVVAARTIEAGRRFGLVLEHEGGALKAGAGDVRMGAMAVDAPAHRERRHLLDAIHRLDRTVASPAVDPREHVLAVVEVNEVGKVVHLHPSDGPVHLNGFFQLLDLDRLFFDERMTIHADARRRNAGLTAPSSPLITQA